MYRISYKICEYLSIYLSIYQSFYLSIHTHIYIYTYVYMHAVVGSLGPVGLGSIGVLDISVQMPCAPRRNLQPNTAQLLETLP